MHKSSRVWNAVAVEWSWRILVDGGLLVFWFTLTHLLSVGRLRLLMADLDSEETKKEEESF